MTKYRMFVHLLRKSPVLAVVFMFKKLRRKARVLLPGDDWNKNWLGEEMRPFNSMR